MACGFGQVLLHYERSLRIWWNWQTRYFEVVVGQPVQVQVLLCAPHLPVALLDLRGSRFWNLGRNAPGDRVAKRFHLERLADEQVHERQRAVTLDFFGIGGEHYHWLARASRFDRLGQFVARHRRHEEVRDDQVELSRLEERQGLSAAAGRVHKMTIKTQ